MREPFLEYCDALACNRNVFLSEHSDLFKAFITIDSNFQEIVRLPQTHRDSKDKSHVSLIPFLFLLQRQARTAFDVMSAKQSYQAWLLLRPGIEAALIIGKFVDDPNNAAVWRNRDENRKTYQKTFTGEYLQSQSLSNSDQIQTVLKTINNRFVHVNPHYYQRHLTINRTEDTVNVRLNYFENDSLQNDSLQVVNALAFLHLLLVVQEALLALFNQLFGTNASLPSSLANLIHTYGERMKTFAEANMEYKAVLSDLGGWSGENT